MPGAADWLVLFRSSNREILRRSAAALLKCEGVPLEILLEILDQFSRDGLGAETERVLLARNGIELFAPMVHRLTSADDFVREVACKLLGESRNRDATPHLLPMMDDRAAMVRRAAGLGLVTLGDPRGIECLRRHLLARNDDDLGIRWAVERALLDMERSYPQHSQAESIHDSEFGLLLQNIDQSRFEGIGLFRETEIDLVFDTKSVVELELLVNFAKPLWEQREIWFTAWRKVLFDYYVSKLAENWWQQDYELTEEIFYRLLGSPIAAEFSNRDGEFSYVLSGGAEELFGDHGIDSMGSSISQMTVLF